MTELTTKGVAQPLPWQIPQWQHLLRLRSEGKMPHALLFRGPQGTGKQHLATALAQAVLCQQPQDGIACGECKTCLLGFVGNHPDWLTISLEDDARQIKIDQIRDVVDFATKKAQLGGYRVIVVNPAEAMNINAANALLKSLEEPGSDTLMILVSHQSSGLLATIRSRCQAIDFPLPALAEALDWMSSQADDAQQAQRLLAIAGGAPVAAAALKSASWPAERDEICREWLAVLEHKADLSVVATRWSKLPMVEVLRCLLAWMIDIHRIRAGAPQQVQNQDMLSILQVASSRLRTDSQLHDFYPFLQRVYQKALSTANPNTVLLLESVLIRWQRLGL